MEKEILDTEKMSLEDWLDIVFNPPQNKTFINYMFPTNKHCEEYLQSINDRSEQEVIRLIYKFLIPSGTLGIDSWNLRKLIVTKKSDPKFYATMLGSMYYRRLLLLAIKRSKLPPWEGITWILDLLPHFPRQALEGLNAYILAHAQQLPDGRTSGLYEVSEIIRAKFIGMPGTTLDSCKVLLDLHWRDFEILIEKLYKEMGYKTQLTPAQKDKGRDIIASRKESGKLEHLRIECKRYREEAVGLELVQRLLGVVSWEKVNKGVLVTTSRFTKPAQEFATENPRIELINGEQLVFLLNEYLGARWTLQIERLISKPLDKTV